MQQYCRLVAWLGGFQHVRYSHSSRRKKVEIVMKRLERILDNQAQPGSISVHLQGAWLEALDLSTFNLGAGDQEVCVIMWAAWALSQVWFCKVTSRSPYCLKGPYGSHEMTAPPWGWSHHPGICLRGIAILGFQDDYRLETVLETCRCLFMGSGTGDVKVDNKISQLVLPLRLPALKEDKVGEVSCF